MKIMMAVIVATAIAATQTAVANTKVCKKAPNGQTYCCKRSDEIIKIQWQKVEGGKKWRISCFPPTSQ